MRRVHGRIRSLRMAYGSTIDGDSGCVPSVQRQELAAAVGDKHISPAKGCTVAKAGVSHLLLSQA